jgi:hypothetical protein
MTLETSTINMLLGLIVGLQAWIIHKLFKLEKKISLIILRCKFHKAQPDEKDEE